MNEDTINYNNPEDNSIETLIEDAALEAHKVFSDHVIRRTVPNFIDGLKPVQRRIIYAMYDLKNTSFIKSIRLVGEVIGKYHPHGNIPVYMAMVKLAQPFANNHCLITPQGNFGSIDGDPAADARYTEVKLSTFSEVLLKEMNDQYVTWSNNFDNTRLEPDYLPFLLPNILINGSFGIGVGAMTSVLPHNLKEITNALLFALKNDSFNLDQLLDFIKGPDFVTGGFMLSDGIKALYEDGIGSVICRGKIEQENNSLIISEVPFQSKVSTIIQEISILRKKHFEIKEILDESSRNLIRIKINLSKNAQIDCIKELIFSQTSMQKSFYMNMLMMNNEKLIKYNLVNLFNDFKSYLIDLFTKKISLEKKNLEKEKHYLNLIIWSINNINDILNIIKNQKSLTAIKDELKKIGLTNNEDIDIILNLKLYRLSSFNYENTMAKISEILNKISKADLLLNNKHLLLNEIANEVSYLVSKIKTTERKTIIDHPEFLTKKIVPAFEIWLLVIANKYILKTKEDFIKEKRLSSSTLNFSTDLGAPEMVFSANNQDELVILTNFGRAIKTSANNIPFFNSTIKNNSFIDLQENETLISILNINNMKENVIFVTSAGKIARINSSIVKKTRNNSKFMKLNEKNRLINVFSCDINESIFMATKNGIFSYFLVSAIRLSSKNVQGVIGMRLKKKSDQIINAGVIFNGKIHLFTKNGLGKSVCIDNFRQTNKGVSGFFGIKLEKGDDLCCAISLKRETFILITNVGKLFRGNTSQINTYGRYAKGHRIVKLTDNQHIISVI